MKKNDDTNKQSEFERGHKDGYTHQSWHNEHGARSGAGLGPNAPKEPDNPDYNRGVDQGRNDRNNNGR